MTGMILPQPAEAFEWRGPEDRPSLVCRELEAFARHLFTTERWTLGRRDTSVHDEGWREVAAAAGVTDGRVVHVHQVHGNEVVDAAHATPQTPADIVVSSDPTRAISVRSADCAALLVADPATGAVAAAHAGWRGMARRVPSVVVEAMASRFGSRPSNLRVALGPSIGACCYEVAADVREAFAQAGFDRRDLECWFFDRPQPSPANPRMPSVDPGQRHGRWFFDGPRSVRDQLIAAGVTAGHIWSPGLCTASHPGVFCSYRRDGSPAGRLAAVIVAPSPSP